MVRVTISCTGREPMAVPASAESTISDILNENGITFVNGTTFVDGVAVQPTRLLQDVIGEAEETMILVSTKADAA